ncbi:MBL fold metallo-hydrolase [Clostridium grantii]|uniref:Glyoxylase, beta-lactamase superfamily II n=1 Tax=Clostridium grantii DSM 8605 TaxID=1121316 RepID=A0A1M5SJ05_9CLOT|nr:MBL fold metallo-hydrolase [Clostridium grantii]SHH38572.1 Glyoxylase, beta-lactamase superfamily II [Clostridium grantii DSM 8605]
MSIKFETLEVGYLQENCYIVYDESSLEGVVIDPGDEENKIIATIEKIGVDVKYILLTHGHMDHTGAAEALLYKYNVPLLMNEEDYKFIKDNTQVFGEFKKYSTESFLKDKDEVIIGSSKIKCIETPGHSPGGICFLVDDYLFSGDTMFMSNIGRWDLPGGNYSTLVSSLRNKLYVLPEEIRVMPGHGPYTFIKAEKNNY